MHLSLRLAFARTDCTPHDTLCTYGGETVETSRLFAAASFLVQLDGGPEETRTLDLSDANRTLSQLSYRPIFFSARLASLKSIFIIATRRTFVKCEV